MSNDRDPAPRDGETPAGSAADETSSTAGSGDSTASAAAETAAEGGTTPRAAAGSARAAARAAAGARPAPKARRSVTVDADGEPTTAETADGDDEAVGAVKARSERKGGATRSRAEATVGEGRGNIFVRLRRFLREVVAELRKVIWPSRNQMVTYTIVVIVFVSVMVAYVAGLDVLFARGVLAIFG